MNTTVSPKKLFALLAGAMALTSIPLVSSAQLYNVDAGDLNTQNYSGAAVLGSSGDVWNAYTAPGIGDHTGRGDFRFHRKLHRWRSSGYLELCHRG